jgi:hypothetical protein
LEVSVTTVLAQFVSRQFYIINPNRVGDGVEKFLATVNPRMRIVGSRGGTFRAPMILSTLNGIQTERLIMRSL